MEAGGSMFSEAGATEGIEHVTQGLELFALVLCKSNAHW